MNDSEDEFSSSNDELIGDLKIGGEDDNYLGRSDAETCLSDSALLNDDEVADRQ